MESNWNLEEVSVLKEKKKEDRRINIKMCVCLLSREIILELDLFHAILQER